MIIVKDLHKKYGDHEVLRGIDYRVEPKEVVCVIGPSGSGKSTFLRCLNGLETITSGEVSVNGHLVGDRKTDINTVRREVGMVFQHFNLFPHLKVLDNVMLAPTKVAGVSKDRARAKALELLDKVG